MRNVLGRLKRFHRTAVRLAPVSGGYGAALFTQIRQKLNREFLASVGVGGTQILYRRDDLSAIEEVIVEDEYKFLRHEISSIGVPRILDVGAHIGCFGATMLSENAQCEILSVEANPDNYRLLSENIKAAQRLGAAWRCINAAAAGKTGERTLISNTGPTMSYRVSSGTRGTPVETIDLADLIESFAPATTRIDLCKVDIEGSEVDFLEGVRERLSDIRVLVVELHPNICNSDRLRRILEEEFSVVRDMSRSTSSKPLLLCKQ